MGAFAVVVGAAQPTYAVDKIGGIVPQIVSAERVYALILKPLGRAFSPRPVVVIFNAFDRRFVLELGPSATIPRDVSFDRMTYSGVVRRYVDQEYWQGVVRGQPDSRVAATFRDGALDGLVRIGSRYFVLEPESRFDPSASPSASVAYRLEDVRPGIPVIDRLRDSLAEIDAQSASAHNAMIYGGKRSLEVALVADYEFFVRHGERTAERMLDLINMVDVVYRHRLGLSLRVTYAAVFEKIEDPFAVFRTGDAFADLTRATAAFGDYRMASGGALRHAAVVHLFSDGLDAQAGLGSASAMCRPAMGVSISASASSSVGLHALAIAHEVAHGFGPYHQTAATGGCSSPPDAVASAD